MDRDLRLDTLLKKGAFSEAASLCLQLINERPSETDLRWKLLVCYVRLKEFRKAVRAIEDLLSIAPMEERKVSALCLSADQFVSREFHRRRDIVLGWGLLALAIASAIATGVFGWIGAVAVVGGCAAVLLAGEAVARLVIYRRYSFPGEGVVAPPDDSPLRIYYAYDRPTYQFNAETCFDYVPGTHAVRLDVLDGKVVEVNGVDIDENGNVGSGDTTFPKDHLRILVVGDSFTALPGNGDRVEEYEGVEWPGFLKSFLSTKLNRPVAVLNFGRGSAGVLQMMDMAAVQCERHRPDILLFCFIARDLNRPRRYHSSMRIAGTTHEFMHHDATPSPNLEKALYASVVDSRITREWAEERLRRGDEDEILRDLNRRYKKMRSRNSGRRFSIFTRDRSCLLDMLVAGTPFLEMKHEPYGGYDLVRFKDYTEDQKFIDSHRRVLETGAEIIPVHLPEIEEIMKPGLFLTRSKNTGALLASLKRVLDKKVLHLGQHMSFVPPEQVLKQFPRKPYDAHPSLWGKILYARVLTELLPGASTKIQAAMSSRTQQ